MRKLLLSVFLTLLVWMITLAEPSLAVDIANGAKIFDAQCAGCHLNGSNIVRRGKNLKLKALRKYGMDSPEAIAFLVSNGKGNMSAYKDRLTAEEIDDVSVYVLDQAKKGW